MKRVSLIAAGLLAASWAAARAQAATADGSSASGSSPAPANAEVKSPPTTVEVEVIPPQAKPVSPPSAPPGTIETGPAATATTPSGAEVPAPAANVDVNVSPPMQAPPTVAPLQTRVMPPARTITANSAAISGAVVEDVTPTQALPPPRAGTAVGVGGGTSHTWVGRVGTGLLVGGGYEDFTNNTLRNMTGGAGTWNARVLAGTRQYFGAEAAYVGAARGVDALGVQSNAMLMSNGLEGALRVNVPVVMRRAQLLEPFAFAGVGWSHYQVTNTNVNTSDIASDDDVMTVPVGGGLEYAIGRFMADARFTYRSTYYNDLMRTGGNLNNWGVSTQIGFSF